MASVVFFCLSLPAFAAPLSNTTDYGGLFPRSYNVTEHSNNVDALQSQTAFTSSWMPTAKVRGTSDVLWSCVVTLSLCVYTAIHLNIPPIGESQFAFWLRKTKWVMLAIFAPEIVVYTAFQQWSEARRTITELNDLMDKRNYEPTAGDRRISQFDKQPAKFDMTYGFYVVMGGFVTDIAHLNSKFSRITLTSDWLIALAHNGHFLEVSNRSIKDKSKADVLAKCLVIAQVTWLIVNCVARKVLGLPLTLLEIHTLVHVTCALIMYALWFIKPLDIKDPTFIPTNAGEIEKITALIIMGSTGLSAYDTPSEASILQIKKPSLYRNKHEPRYTFDYVKQTFTVSENGSSPLAISTISNTLQQIPSWSDTQETKDYSYTSESTPVAMTVETGTFFNGLLGPGYQYYLKRSKEAFREGYALHAYERVLHRPVQVHRRCKLTRMDVRRWQHAVDLLSTNTETIFPAKETQLDEVLRDQFGIPQGTLHCAELASNLAPMSTKSIRGALGLIKASFDEQPYPAFEGFLLALLPAIYGGVHISAWHYTFRTNVECWMWRASCLNLLCSSATFWLGSLFHYLAAHSDFFYDLGIVGSWFSFAILIINVPVYVAARAFLVIESFISLRYVPIGVYSTVRWSNLIPHI